MLNKYSLEISKIFKYAEEEMFKLKHPYVGTEHLLLSLLKNDLKVKNIASKFNLDYDSFKSELIKIVGCSNKETSFVLYTPLLKRVINLAVEEALEKKEKLNTIHLLKALLEEGDGIAIRLLYGMNINLDKMYDELNFSSKSASRHLEILNIGKNLNKLVSDEDIVVGRENELSLIIETLIRKNKNNPLLVGDAGVGKTAIVEELARRINTNSVPECLQNKMIIMLEMGALISGTKYRGEFEEKLTKIINELENNQDIILFIDEIHTMVNAGGAEGAINASDILKPYLARGKIKIIGATTTLEYNKFILKDKALNRRFELIKVNEPSTEETEYILNKVKSSYEKHYNIKLTLKNIKDIVKYANNFIIDRKNPDKSLDILDSLCAMKTVENMNAANINKLESNLEDIIIKKNKMVKNNNFKKALSFYNQEKLINEEISELKNKSIKISENDIINLISRKCNIPIIKRNSINYSNLEKNLNKKIFGQKLAIKKIMNNIKNNKFEKPLSLLLVGSTGVGKTETVKQLCKLLNMNLVRLDMSEYNQNITINRLIGSSAGYVGYDDGAIFDKIKMQPYSCILLDELEKASSSVLNLFLQILDEGFVTNAKGEKIDFKNTFIIATSNVTGNKKIGFMENSINYNDDFSKEFIARFTDIISFKDIDEETIKEYLKENNILDYNIIKDYDYKKKGFRGLDKYLSLKCKTKIKN